tara:strand:+ start:9911 stop:10240 length:330 start_codon:yes stop_codon:yes gene_type:complete
VAAPVFLGVVVAHARFEVEGWIGAVGPLYAVLALILLLELSANIQNLARAFRVYILVLRLVVLGALLALRGLLLPWVRRCVFFCERIVPLFPRAGRLWGFWHCDVWVRQ